MNSVCQKGAYDAAETCLKCGWFKGPLQSVLKHENLCDGTKATPGYIKMIDDLCIGLFEGHSSRFSNIKGDGSPYDTFVSALGNFQGRSKNGTPTSRFDSNLLLLTSFRSLAIAKEAKGFLTGLTNLYKGSRSNASLVLKVFFDRIFRQYSKKIKPSIGKNKQPGKKNKLSVGKVDGEQEEEGKLLEHGKLLLTDSCGKGKQKIHQENGRWSPTQPILKRYVVLCLDGGEPSDYLLMKNGSTFYGYSKQVEGCYMGEPIHDQLVVSVVSDANLKEGKVDDAKAEKKKNRNHSKKLKRQAKALIGKVDDQQEDQPKLSKREKLLITGHSCKGKDIVHQGNGRSPNQIVLKRDIVLCLDGGEPSVSLSDGFNKQVEALYLVEPTDELVVNEGGDEELVLQFDDLEPLKFHQVSANWRSHWSEQIGYIWRTSGETYDFESYAMMSTCGVKFDPALDEAIILVSKVEPSRGEDDEIILWKGTNT